MDRFCFFCNSVVPHQQQQSGNKGKGKSKSSAFFGPEESIRLIFLLHKLVGIPLFDCQKYLELSKTSSGGGIQLCGQCDTLVTECKIVQDKMTKLQFQFQNLQAILQNHILCGGNNGGGESSIAAVSNPMRASVRQDLCLNLATVPTSSSTTTLETDVGRGGTSTGTPLLIVQSGQHYTTTDVSQRVDQGGFTHLEFPHQSNVIMVETAIKDEDDEPLDFCYDGGDIWKDSTTEGLIENGTNSNAGQRRAGQVQNVRGTLYPREKEMYSCSWLGCKKIYARKKLLEVHERLVHHVDQGRGYTCSVPGCDLSFQETKDLLFHERRCKCQRHQCTWDGCDKTFRTSKLLHGHISAVHRKKQYRDIFKCQVPECMLSFTDSKKLEIHQSRCRFKYETLKTMDEDKEEVYIT